MDELDFLFSSPAVFLNAPVPPKCVPPLHKAAEFRKLEAVKVFLHHGADPNRTTEESENH